MCMRVKYVLPLCIIKKVHTLCLISHTVLYKAFRSSGMDLTFWMDPPAAMISFFTSSFQRLSAVKSVVIRYLLEF